MSLELSVLSSFCATGLQRLYAAHGQWPITGTNKVELYAFMKCGPRLGSSRRAPSAQRWRLWARGAATEEEAAERRRHPFQRPGDRSPFPRSWPEITGSPEVGRLAESALIFLVENDPPPARAPSSPDSHPRAGHRQHHPAGFISSIPPMIRPLPRADFPCAAWSRSRPSSSSSPARATSPTGGAGRREPRPRARARPPLHPAQSRFTPRPLPDAPHLRLPQPENVHGFESRHPALELPRGHQARRVAGSGQSCDHRQDRPHPRLGPLEGALLRSSPGEKSRARPANSANGLPSSANCAPAAAAPSSTADLSRSSSSVAMP